MKKTRKRDMHIRAELPPGWDILFNPDIPSGEEPPGARSRIEEVRAEILAKALGMNAGEFEAFKKFGELKSPHREAASRKIIADLVLNRSMDRDVRVALAIVESESLLAGYATLDEPHRGAIRRLIATIKSYLSDSTRRRPLNILMIASPGAGKSHFIEKLAESMKGERVRSVTFNMATMQSADDMARPIDEVRNLKVNDQLPLLFLDEFDSDPAHYAGLLPLLWQGELQIGHRHLKLGKAVIVLAGSSPSIPKIMKASALMRLDDETGSDLAGVGKLVDLLSRINGGVLEIPDLDLRVEGRDRRIDKVCVATALIARRFGDDLTSIPRALLRFIADTRFRYGVRSIAHLVDLVDGKALREGAMTIDALGLPVADEDELQQSSLTHHLRDKDQGPGIVIRWKEYSEDQVDVSFRRPSLPWSALLARDRG
jgi:hypothetical protein